jgi:lactoylglutathione lyase
MNTGLQYLHTMIRVKDLDRALNFFNLLGLKEVRRKEVESGRFTLVFLNDGVTDAELELTYNWDQTEEYGGGRNFGHLAYKVDDIYKTCEFLESNNIEILRPPRDGYMAFIKSPDGISVELLQKGEALAPKEPWQSRENKGSW